jgi:hypothetical protein
MRKGNLTTDYTTTISVGFQRRVVWRPEAEVFYGFPPSLQSNSAIVPSNTPRPLPFTSFTIHHSGIILSLEVIEPELLRKRR